MKYIAILTFLFFMGCASNSLIINYDNTNPIKVEQATQGLEITDVLPSSQKVDGTIALRSIEEPGL